MSEAQGRTFTVGEDDDGIRLDRWFKRHQSDISFNLVSRWARTGQLRLDGKRVAPGDRIEVGQTILIPPADARPAPTGKRAPRRDPLTPEDEELVRSLGVERNAHAQARLIDDIIDVTRIARGKLGAQGRIGLTVVTTVVVSVIGVRQELLLLALGALPARPVERRCIAAGRRRSGFPGNARSLEGGSGWFPAHPAGVHTRHRRIGRATRDAAAPD